MILPQRWQIIVSFALSLIIGKLALFAHFSPVAPSPSGDSTLISNEPSFFN